MPIVVLADSIALRFTHSESFSKTTQLLLNFKKLIWENNSCLHINTKFRIEFFLSNTQFYDIFYTSIYLVEEKIQYR